MKESSIYDGMTSPKDDYEVIEDDEGWGVRNITHDYIFPPRWSRHRFALNWKFHLMRFRWRPVRIKLYRILKMASTRPKAGVTPVDFAREWFIPFLKEKRNPDMTEVEFHENCAKRARRQMLKYARAGLFRYDPKGERDRWFIDTAGILRLAEIVTWLKTNKIAH